MSPGDHVSVYNRSHWGGITHRGEGLLLKMTYAAYDPSMSRWHVLMHVGTVETHKEANLKVIE